MAAADLQAQRLCCSIFLTLMSTFRKNLKAEIGVFFPMIMLRPIEPAVGGSMPNAAGERSRCADLFAGGAWCKEATTEISSAVACREIACFGFLRVLVGKEAPHEEDSPRCCLPACLPAL